MLKCASPLQWSRQEESDPRNKGLVKWLRVFVSRDIAQQGLEGEREMGIIQIQYSHMKFTHKISLLKISKGLSW